MAKKLNVLWTVGGLAVSICSILTGWHYAFSSCPIVSGLGIVGYGAIASGIVGFVMSWRELTR